MNKARVRAEHEYGLMVIVAGAFLGEDKKIVSYGGVVRKGWHPLKFKRVGCSRKLEVVDTLNMNAALIPRTVLSEIGFLADYFIHSGADFEYGLRCVKRGGKVLQAPGVVGECSRNPAIGRSIERNIGVVERINRMIDAKEKPISVRYRYYKEYGGALWLILFLAPFFKAFVSRRL